LQKKKEGGGLRKKSRYQLHERGHFGLFRGKKRRRKTCDHASFEGEREVTFSWYDCLQTTVWCIGGGGERGHFSNQHSIRRKKVEGKSVAVLHEKGKGGGGRPPVLSEKEGRNPFGDPQGRESSPIFNNIW